MVGASWTLGLSFIVLTVAFHTTGVVIMAFAGRRIRARVEKQKLHPLRVIAILIGVIGAVAVILAVLHGLEAMFWAAAYLWLGAFGSYIDALLYSLGTMTSASTVEVGIPVAYGERAGGDGRRATVRHQHGVYFHGDVTYGQCSPADAPSRYRPATVLIAATRLRKDEALARRCDQVDLDACTLKVSAPSPPPSPAARRDDAATPYRNLPGRRLRRPLARSNHRLRQTCIAGQCL